MLAEGSDVTSVKRHLHRPHGRLHRSPWLNTRCDTLPDRPDPDAHGGPRTRMPSPQPA